MNGSLLGVFFLSLESSHFFKTQSVTDLELPRWDLSSDRVTANLTLSQCVSHLWVLEAHRSEPSLSGSHSASVKALSTFGHGCPECLEMQGHTHAAQGVANSWHCHPRSSQQLTPLKFGSSAKPSLGKHTSGVFLSRNGQGGPVYMSWGLPSFEPSGLLGQGLSTAPYRSIPRLLFLPMYRLRVGPPL